MSGFEIVFLIDYMIVVSVLCVVLDQPRGAQIIANIVGIAVILGAGGA